MVLSKQDIQLIEYSVKQHLYQGNPGGFIKYNLYVVN